MELPERRWRTERRPRSIDTTNPIAARNRTRVCATATQSRLSDELRGAPAGGCHDGSMSWSPGAPSPHDPTLDQIANVLDPLLTPLGFAAGQLGCSDREAAVTFCRGDVDSVDGACVDLVVELEADPVWRICDVRYWGFPSERWHLAFPTDVDLVAQLDVLSRTLPAQLT
jgi:hypothetical protein